MDEQSTELPKNPVREEFYHMLIEGISTEFPQDLPEIKRNIDRYYALMKTIYPDRGVILDIILKYEDIVRDCTDNINEILRGDLHTFHHIRILWSNRWEAMGDLSNKVITNPNIVSDIDINNFIKDIDLLEVSIQSLQELWGLHESDFIGVSKLQENARRLWDSITLEMLRIGYELHYFDFFKSDHPMVRTFWDRVQPTPKTFEAASTTLIRPEIYQHILDVIKDETLDTTLNKTSQWLGFYPRLIGWRKQDLVQAIKDTGLNQQIVIPDQRSEEYSLLIQELSEVNEYSERYFLIGLELSEFPRSMSTEGLMTSELKQRMDRIKGLGPRKNYTERGPSFLYEKRGTLIGFEGDSYLPKYYYEAIYRKIFNTLVNVDWKEVCRTNMVDIEKLRQISVTDFNYTEGMVSNLEYGELCDLLERESTERRNIKIELLEGIPAAQSAVLYRPGGKLMRDIQAQALTRPGGVFAPIEEKKSRDRDIDIFYNKVKEICSDKNSTRDDIFDIILDMDLLQLILHLPRERHTKDVYCSIVENYMKSTIMRSPQR